MPKYVFKCDKCDKTKHLYTSIATKNVGCDCGGSMNRQIPVISGQQVYETVDSYVGTKWTDGQEADLKKRRDNHYWEVEVPKMIETYSLETCLENGWLVYNEKQELVINKPPSQR